MYGMSPYLSIEMQTLKNKSRTWRSSRQNPCYPWRCCLAPFEIWLRSHSPRFHRWVFAWFCLSPLNNPFLCRQWWTCKSWHNITNIMLYIKELNKWTAEDLQIPNNNILSHFTFYNTQSSLSSSSRGDEVMLYASWPIDLHSNAVCRFNMLSESCPMWLFSTVFQWSRGPEDMSEVCAYISAIKDCTLNVGIIKEHCCMSVLELYKCWNSAICGCWLRLGIASSRQVLAGSKRWSLGHWSRISTCERIYLSI